MSFRKLHRLRFITVDATGTLLKFRRPPVEIYAEFGKKHGIEVDQDKLAQSFKAQWVSLNEKEPHFGKAWRPWWTHFVVGTFKVWK
jgi:hypothetical protein